MSANTFLPRGRMSLGTPIVLSYHGGGKGKQREYSNERMGEALIYDRKEERWVINAGDVQSLLLKAGQNDEIDTGDEVQETRVILVLGDPSSQDLQTLLSTPRVSPHSHPAHVHLKPEPDTLIILVTHKPPALPPPPPPNGRRPRSLIILRLLPTPLPAVTQAQQRLSSILTRAEGISRSWRNSPESIFPTAVQPNTRCATQWSEVVPGGDFCVVEEIGYTAATASSHSGMQRFPSSNKPPKFSFPKLRFKPKHDLMEPRRPAFDALINFITDPFLPSLSESSSSAEVDNETILKHVMLVSTLSQAYLTASQSGDTSDTDAVRDRSRGRSTHRESERGRSTQRSSSLESIKRFFSRSRSRNRTISTSMGEVDARRSTSISRNGNNVDQASSSTWSLSSLIRRGRQLSESGTAPQMGTGAESGVNVGESTSSLPLASRVSNEAEAQAHTGRVTPKKGDDGPAYDTDETPSTPTPSMVTTREVGTPEYERTGHGKIVLPKERRRSISVGSEGNDKDKDPQAVVQEAREREREKVKQKVLNSWSRNQLGLANAAGGALEKMRGRRGGRERSRGRSLERREGENGMTRGSQGGRAHIIHVIPRSMLSPPQSKANSYSSQDQTKPVSRELPPRPGSKSPASRNQTSPLRQGSVGSQLEVSNSFTSKAGSSAERSESESMHKLEGTAQASSHAALVTVDATFNLPNPYDTEDGIEVQPAGLPSSSSNTSDITPLPSSTLPQANVHEPTSPLDQTRSISPPPPPPSRSLTLSPALSAALESAAPYSSLGRALSSARSPRESTIFSVLGESERELAKRRGRELVRCSSAYEAASAAAVAAMEVQMSRATSLLPLVSSEETLMFPSPTKEGPDTGIGSRPPQIPASLLPDPHRHSTWSGIFNEAVAKIGMGLGSPINHTFSVRGENKAETNGGEEGKGGRSASYPMPLALLSGPFRSSSLDSGIVMPTVGSDSRPPIASAGSISLPYVASPPPITPKSTQTRIPVTPVVDFPSKSYFPSTPDPPDVTFPTLHYPKTELVQRIERFLLSFSYPPPPPPPPDTVLPLPRGAAKPTMVGGAGAAMFNGRGASRDRRDNPEKSVPVKATFEKPAAYLLSSSILGGIFEFSFQRMQISVTMTDLILLGMLDPSQDLVARYHEDLAAASLLGTNLHDRGDFEEDMKVPRVWVGSKQDIDIVRGDRVVAASRRAASEPYSSLAASEHPPSAVSLHAKAIAPAHRSRLRTSSTLRNVSQEQQSDHRNSDATLASGSENVLGTSISDSPKIDLLNLGGDAQDGWTTFVKDTFGSSSSRSPSAVKDEVHDKDTSNTDTEGGLKSPLASKSATTSTPTQTIPVDINTAYTGMPLDAATPLNPTSPSQLQSRPVGAALPIPPTAFLFSGLDWNLTHPNLYQGQTDNSGPSRPANMSNPHTNSRSSYHAANDNSPASARPPPANTSVELETGTNGTCINASTCLELIVKTPSSDTSLSPLEKVSLDSSSSSDASTIPITTDSIFGDGHISERKRSVSASKLKAPSAQFLAELGLGPGDKEKLLRSATTGGRLHMKVPINTSAVLDLHAATIPSSPSDDSTTIGTATPVEARRNHGLWIQRNLNISPRSSTVSSLPPSSTSSPSPPSLGVAVTVHSVSLTSSPSARSRLSIDTPREAGETGTLASSESDSASLHSASAAKQGHFGTTSPTMSTISEANLTHEATTNEISNGNANNNGNPPPPPLYTESESDSESLSILSLPLVSLDRSAVPSTSSTCSDSRSTIASSGLFSSTSFNAPPAVVQRSITSTLKRPMSLSASASVSVRGPRPIPSRQLSRAADSESGLGNHSRTRSIESLSSMQSIQSGKEALALYAGIAGEKLGSR